MVLLCGSKCFVGKSTIKKSRNLCETDSRLCILCRRNAVRFFINLREVGKVLESYFKADIRYLASPFPYQLAGGFEATVYQPFRGESVLHFLKSRLNVDRLRPV